MHGARDYNAPCRPTHHTLTQCRLSVGPPSVKPVQPEPALYHNACSPEGSYAGLRHKKALDIQSQGLVVVGKMA